MRTLIVDNYDSFTYNLFHFLARVNGEEPVVVRNDDPSWRLGVLAEFDNVVLSPGPGTPARAADFGICRELVDRCDLPLLGVCLGYQGIALQYGATVGRAPEPRHGRTSPVLHDGTGLFAGLPLPFEAVRYHSLAVGGLPEELAVTAWRPTESSWDCVTANVPCGACSSIPSRWLPSTGRNCWRTSGT